MEKFMFLFRGGDANEDLSPEQMQDHMQVWMQWMKELDNKDQLVAGEPLDKKGKQVKGTSRVVTDGPYAEAKEMVGGYLIVNAESLEEAVEISKACPIFEFDSGHVEVRPIMPMDLEG